MKIRAKIINHVVSFCENYSSIPANAVTENWIIRKESSDSVSSSYQLYSWTVTNKVTGAEFKASTNAVGKIYLTCVNIGNEKVISKYEGNIIG